jgi:hypothetical protein
MHLTTDGADREPTYYPALQELNPSIGSNARFDSFAPAHSPLPSRLSRLSCGFPARGIRSRQLILFSLGGYGRIITLGQEDGKD